MSFVLCSINHRLVSIVVLRILAVCGLRPAEILVLAD
jgi:hypothetical protein